MSNDGVVTAQAVIFPDKHPSLYTLAESFLRPGKPKSDFVSANMERRATLTSGSSSTLDSAGTSELHCRYEESHLSGKVTRTNTISVKGLSEHVALDADSAATAVDPQVMEPQTIVLMTRCSVHDVQMSVYLKLWRVFC